MGKRGAAIRLWLIILSFVTILFGAVDSVSVASSAAVAVEHEAKKDVVVLLHGIGHSKWNMSPIERSLKRHGYDVLNLSYPSLKKDIPNLAKWLDAQLTSHNIWQDYQRVNFVTHSMGGLVTGQYLESHKSDLLEQKIGRVVMLGVPNGGSEVADLLEEFWLYKLAYGPAGQQLTTLHRADNRLNPWYELGVIAGRGNLLYPVGDYIIPHDNDGRVSVQNTKVKNMKDHKVLDVQHGLMAWSSIVNVQIRHFLQQGTFNDLCVSAKDVSGCER